MDSYTHTQGAKFGILSLSRHDEQPSISRQSIYKYTLLIIIDIFTCNHTDKLELCLKVFLILNHTHLRYANSSDYLNLFTFFAHA